MNQSALPHNASTMVLIGASLLSVALGTVHGFSVFLVPLEQAFGASRNAISLSYSLALVCITLSVLAGHRFYDLVSPHLLVLLVSGGAILGVSLAAFASGIFWVWVGFGVVFGLANGMGYGFGLQFAGRSNAGRSGFAMGVVTAAYALGAIVAPIGFDAALTWGGFSAAMWGLAGFIGVMGMVAAGLVWASQLQFGAVAEQSGEQRANGVLLWWLGYGAAVFSGLMVIGHAQGIVVSRGYDGASWHAVALISVFNLAGSLVGGKMTDIMRPLVPMVLLPGLSLVATVVLVSGVSLFPALAVIGFAYGGIIAAYPAAISAQYGSQAGPAVYGKVFTAWGAAGLAGPWIAGYLFDQFGSYQLALWLAAALAAVAMVVTLQRET